MRSVNIFNNQFSDYKTISHDRFGRNKIGKQQKYRDKTEKKPAKGFMLLAARFKL